MSDEAVGTGLAIPQSSGGLTTQSKYATSQAMAQVGSGSAFLPRIQLLGSNSRLCKIGRAKIGTFAAVSNKDKIVADLTDQFDFLLLKWRPKALRIDGDDTRGYYNPDSDTFRKIEEDSKKRVMGAMFGPEYLVYVPTCDQICTFFFGNPTMRRATPEMFGILQEGEKQGVYKAASVRSTLIEKPKKGWSWHGPVVSACSTPLPVPAPGSPESMALFERIDAEIKKFCNPQEEEVEEAEEAEGGGEERAQ